MKIRRRKRLLYLAVSLLLLGPWLPPAAAQLLGPEFQVNTYTTNDQRRLAVAADGSGNFVVAWEDAFQDGSGEGIFGQRFNSAGSPVGSELQVNAFTTSSQRRPAVAADLSGNFVVVWNSYIQDGSGYGVFGQRYDSAGSPVGSEFQVNTYTTSSQSNPVVSGDGSGSFVVVWQSSSGQDGSSFGVFGQRFNSAASPVGSEFQVNSYTTGEQGIPTVAADGSGNFVVAWESYPQDGSNTGIFGQRFNSAGSPVGSEFQVNTYTSSYQGGPKVAVGSSGSFVVAWTSNGQDGPSKGVLGQRFNSAGSPLGSEFQVNTYTTADQQYPAVAADGSGNFVVAWESDGQDGSLGGVFGQRFNSAGSNVGSELRVNTYTTNKQASPAVAADGSGRFVVAWTSDGQDGSSYGAFGQRLRSWIFPDDFESGDVCAWSAAVGSGDICPP